MMLDSGAYSVWNSGSTVDLEEYISFCEGCDWAPIFVNLDVIPKDRDKVNVEEGAKQGWENYRRMLDRLPSEKVLPVYHLGEDPKWLERYLSFGATYIGIGRLTVSTARDAEGLRSVRKMLVEDGKPVVRLHGFAVASWDLMGILPW